MGSQERRTRERVQTREKILDAARRMFVEHGYEATTMRAIANAIEYTPTAIYHHFKNKDALLTELATLDFRALAGAFQRIGRIEDPIDRLYRIGDAYTEFALSHPMQYQLMFMTRKPGGVFAADATRGDPGQDAYAFLRDACASAISAGVFRQDVTDAEELAQMLWSSVHGLVSLQIVKAGGPIPWRDLRSTSRRLCRTLLRGLLREPSE